MFTLRKACKKRGKNAFSVLEKVQSVFLFPFSSFTVFAKWTLMQKKNI